MSRRPPDVFIESPVVGRCWLLFRWDTSWRDLIMEDVSIWTYEEVQVCRQPGTPLAEIALIKRIIPGARVVAHRSLRKRRRRRLFGSGVREPDVD